MKNILKEIMYVHICYCALRVIIEKISYTKNIYTCVSISLKKLRRRNAYGALRSREHCIKLAPPSLSLDSFLCNLCQPPWHMCTYVCISCAINERTLCKQSVASRSVLPSTSSRKSLSRATRLDSTRLDVFITRCI